MTKDKPTLCLDFDGVIHSYVSGWQGYDVISDPPVEGAIEFLLEAVNHFDVCIFCARSETDRGIRAMQAWLSKHEAVYWKEHPNLSLPKTTLLMNIDFPRKRPPAFVTLDDRAITFTGKFPSMQTLKRFQPWYEKMKNEP